MRTRRLVPVLGLLLLAGGSGCGLLDPEVCHHGILYDVDPREATISVGESFTPTATVTTCPEGVREISPSWSAEDAAIVEVDAGTGRITGLAAGETVVRGTDTEADLVSVRVTVEP